MSYLKSIVKKILVAWSGNSLSQNILDRTVQICFHLMGITSGSVVTESGEIVIMKILKKISNQPYIIFDVGANSGQFLNLIMSNLDQGTYTVHCFEPALHSFQSLKMNLGYGENESIKLNNFGMGKATGEVLLYYDSYGSGFASITKRNLDHWGVSFSISETVKIDTIDNYCAQNGIYTIDWLKIDVEGNIMFQLQLDKN